MMQRSRPCLLRALALAARSLQAIGSPCGGSGALLCAADLALVRRAFTLAAAWPAVQRNCKLECVQPARRQWQVASSFSSAPAEAPAEPAASSSGAEEPVRLTDSAVQRLRELLADASKPGEKVLRLTVEAGGCSGFSYSFNLDAAPREDDLVFERDGVVLVVDAVSYEFVRGASVDFTDSLIKTTFEVVQNPNSASSCGCGSSFAPKF